MTLKQALSEHRAGLQDRWLERVLATYPADASTFLKRDHNRFSNPVGQTIADGLNEVIDLLLAEPGPTSSEHPNAELFGPPLSQIVKIRAIQEFEASEAVGFLFLLKTIIRELLPADFESEAAQRNELRELDGEIDRLALLAFDIYADCLRQVMNIRINEIKRSVSGLVRRLNREGDLPEPLNNLKLVKEPEHQA